jgi:hypothetical protein
LIKNNYRLGILKSAKRYPIIIPPNGEVTIEGYADKTLPYHQTVALIQAAEKSVIPKDLDIIPNLVDYNYNVTGPVPVTISNITTRTVKVSPRSIIAELQAVTVEDLPEPTPVI